MWNFLWWYYIDGSPFMQPAFAIFYVNSYKQLDKDEENALSMNSFTDGEGTYVNYFNALYPVFFFC